MLSITLVFVMLFRVSFEENNNDDNSGIILSMNDQCGTSNYEQKLYHVFNDCNCLYEDISGRRGCSKILSEDSTGDITFEIFSEENLDCDPEFSSPIETIKTTIGVCDYNSKSGYSYQFVSGSLNDLKNDVKSESVSHYWSETYSKPNCEGNVVFASVEKNRETVTLCPYSNCRDLKGRSVRELIDCGNDNDDDDDDDNDFELYGFMRSEAGKVIAIVVVCVFVLCSMAMTVIAAFVVLFCLKFESDESVPDDEEENLSFQGNFSDNSSNLSSETDSYYSSGSGIMLTDE